LHAEGFGVVVYPKPTRLRPAAEWPLGDLKESLPRAFSGHRVPRLASLHLYAQLSGTRRCPPVQKDES